MAEQSEFEKKLGALQKQSDEYLNGWKRAKADLINYQKEESRRFEELASFSNLALVKELLSVMDSFDLSLASLSDVDAGKKGMALIRGQLLDILKRQGVEMIAPKRGDPFNPGLHEAIGEVEVAEAEKNLSGNIVEVLVTGYQLKSRVIRPAKVKIGK